MFLWVSSWGGAALANDEGGHPGYLSDVRKERYQRLVEFVLPPAPETNEVNLQKLIFTDEFSKDIVDRYQRRFGYTESQINIQAPNRFQEFTNNDGVRVTVEEDVARKRRFGEFMLRKLAEYHVDHYLKSSPSTKKVYEVKEKLSNTSVGIGGGFKLRAKYSFSGSSIKLRLKNPYRITNELIIDLGSSESSVIAHIGFPIFWNIMFRNYYDVELQDLTTVFIKSFKNDMSFSISNISSFDKEAPNDRIIFGWNWRY